MRGNLYPATSILTTIVWENTLKTFQDQIEEVKIISLTDRYKPKHGIRAVVPYFREEIEIEEDDFAYPNDAKRIQAPQAEIMYGGAGDAIDQLSNMDRILYEAQEFIVAGGFNPNLFRMRDEIGALRSTIKKRNKKGELIPVAFEEPTAGGIDLDIAGPFDPEAGLVDMVDKYSKAKWSDLKRDQRINEYQENIWQTYAPALLMYLADIIPDHPMETASPVLLEPEGQLAQIFVPEHESRAVILLSGKADMYVIDEGNISHELLANTYQVIEVDGPCHIILEPLDEAEEDALLIVSKSIVNDERITAIDDLHIRAMASPIGYQDSARLSQHFDLISEEDPDEDSEFLPDDLVENAEFGIRVFPGQLGVLPDIEELGIDIPKDLEEQAKLYFKETAGTISMERWRISKKLKRLDDELTLRLDSAYLGRGYVPPMLRWERILEEESSPSAAAAEYRIEMAASFHRSAKKISNPRRMQEFRERLFKMNQADKALVNLWNPETALESAKVRFCERLKNERIQYIRCNICGRTFIHAPKYATYLSAYYYATNQEELDPPKNEIKCWGRHSEESERFFRENRYTVLRSDPLTAAVSIFKKNKEGTPLVENILRKKVWHWFDRRRENIPAQNKYRLRCQHCNILHDRTCSKVELKEAACPACGLKRRFKVVKFMQVKKAEFHDDSRWWKDRTNAFKSLNATQAQWNTIYKQLWIQQDRMQQCFLMQNVRDNKTPLHERKAQWKAERDMTWDALKTAFQTCTTTYDLEAFEEGASQQVIAGYLSDKEKAILRKERKPVPQSGDILQRSAFDRLTFGDETKIRLAIERRKLKIIEDRRASSVLELRETASIISTVNCAEADSCNCECLGKDNIEAWCYKCNTPSVGKPKFGLLEGDTGFLYIECSNEHCNSKIAIGAHNGLRTVAQTCSQNKR